MAATLCNHCRPLWFTKNDTHIGPDAGSRLQRWEDGVAVNEVTLWTECAN